MADEVEIALETSTSGKYATRLLMDNGFSVYLADPAKLALIFKSVKKNERKDSYKLAKFLRIRELPEVHITSLDTYDHKTLARYRKSPGEESTATKNRIHSMVAVFSTAINESDVFGKRSRKKIEDAASILTAAEYIVMSDLIASVLELNKSKQMVEDEIAKSAGNNRSVKFLMTIPNTNLYSAAAIMSEIDHVRGFSSNEKLAYYAGLVPRQSQSGSRDQRGAHIKARPFNAPICPCDYSIHVYKYFRRMRARYLTLLRSLRKSRVIVAIARILAEFIRKMLSTEIGFLDETDSLTERKMESLRARSLHQSRETSVKDDIKLIRNQAMMAISDKLFS